MMNFDKQQIDRTGGHSYCNFTIFEENLRVKAKALSLLPLEQKIRGGLRRKIPL